MPLNNSDAKSSWHKLDNTANLFPVITKQSFSNVFRLSIVLTETIDAELLQQALTSTLPHFSAFRVQLRRGFFWHYFEPNNAAPVVSEEDDYPGAYIDPTQNDKFLFRVTYFRNRINLEVFHVLSDGVGGYRFLQAITCKYLLLAHPGFFAQEDKNRLWFVEHASNTEDSYLANYIPTKKANYRIGRAYKIKGERRYIKPISVIHAHIQLQGLLDVCRKYGVSVTHYITACLGWAIFVQQMQRKTPKYPLNLFVPVNLRNIFNSTTSLNFFSNIYISLNFKGPNISFEDVLAEVKAQFKEKVTKENMQEKISYTVGGGYSPLVRIVPLPIKMLILRLIFLASAKSSSAGFSNTGSISFPPQFVPFVSAALTLLSCTQAEPIKCAAASYNGVFSLSFTSLLCSTAIQREMVRIFTKDGLDIVVESNGVDYEEM